MMDDETPRDTLARLKSASDALDVAQQDSETTSREIDQTQRHNENANRSMWSTDAQRLTRGVKFTTTE